MDFPFNKDITYFAKTNFRGSDQIFGIKRKDRRQHMYVLGKSGTGKSVMLENMIIQNIHQGEGVCVVDPHGELVEKILETIPKERAQDVIYFNPADTDHNIGFNVLQLDDPRYKHLVASGLMGIFTKIWANAWSSRMEYILNNTILALLDTPDTTLLGIPRMLVDKDYRQYIINNLKDPVVKAFWVHEYEAWRDQFRNEAIAPIQNKVGQFLSSNIVRNVVGQTRSTINIFDIMNNKKIFLVNVSKGRVGEDNSALLGGMLITKIQLSAMERVRIPENQREDFYLYVDEFQNFVTDSFASILSEARKYRLCLVLAHQYIAQLETADSKTVKDAVFGNVGTMVIFRVGADDADALEKEFDPEFLVEDFVNLPNYHIYTKLMVDGVTSRPFSAKTLPPVQVESSEETRDFIIDTSRKLYTRERAVVEAEIQKWSSTVPGQTRPDGEETEGKFKAVCSNCGKSIYVPFEPEAGRPIYCKECLFKIKNGEIEAASGFRPPREKKDNISYDALASLGIEFAAADVPVKRVDSRPAPFRPAGPPPREITSSNTGAPTFVTNKPAPIVMPVSNNRPIVTQKPRTVLPDDPNAPPQGMIKADVRDVSPLKGKPSPVVGIRQKKEEVSPSPNSVSLPNPRAVKTPIQRERKAPDTSGLQSLLKSALTGVMNNNQNQPSVKAGPSNQSESSSAKPNIPSISLNSLKGKDAPQFITPTKDALPERRNLLQDAVLKATTANNETTPVEFVSPETIVAEMKEEAVIEPGIHSVSLEDEGIAAVNISSLENENDIHVDDEKKALEQKIQKEQEDREAAQKKAEEERQKREQLEKEAAELRIAKEAEEKKRQEIERERLRILEEQRAREEALKEEQSKREQEEVRLKQEAERQANERIAREREEAAQKAKEETEAEKARLTQELEEREREFRDAWAKAEAEREQLAREMKIKEEEHQKALEEEKKRHEEALLQKAQIQKEEEKPISPEPVAASSGVTPLPKHAREIPEDLLKQILE